MNHDDNSAALAHEQELEQRRREEEEQQLLRNDPYNRYLDLLTNLYGATHAQHR